MCLEYIDIATLSLGTWKPFVVLIASQVTWVHALDPRSPNLIYGVHILSLHPGDVHDVASQNCAVTFDTLQTGVHRCLPFFLLHDICNQRHALATFRKIIAIAPLWTPRRIARARCSR